MSSMSTLAVVSLSCAIVASSLHATPVVLNVTEDFSTIGSPGWALQTINPGGTLVPSGGGSGGYLGLQFSSTLTPTPQDAILYISSSTVSPTSGYQFTGNMLGAGGDLTISFKFNAFNNPVNTSGGLQLYFKGANLNSTWLYDLTALAPQSPGWVTISTPLSVYSGSGWNVLNPGSGAGTYTDWQSDWANVSEFGFFIAKNNQYGTAPLFGLDDIVLTVPEPETVWLIGMALASLAITFRGKVIHVVRAVANHA